MISTCSSSISHDAVWSSPNVIHAEDYLWSPMHSRECGTSWIVSHKDAVKFGERKEKICVKGPSSSYSLCVVLVVTHPDCLVTKDELLDTIWSNTHAGQQEESQDGDVQTYAILSETARGFRER
jgi:hypothetical protein